MTEERIKAEAKLREHHIGVTQPRIMILEYLMTHFTHPTVDTIYNDLVKDSPGLSRTTVYNATQLLAQQGVIQSLCIDETHVNLDGNTTPHAHLLCRKCGRIIDLPLRGIAEGKASKTFMMDGNVVEEVHQYYKGICKDCQTAQDKDKA